LFSGLLIHLADGGFIDQAFAGAHTEGFEAALAAARRIAPDLAAVAKKCGVAGADIATLFDLWATTNRVSTLYSQGSTNPGKALTRSTRSSIAILQLAGSAFRALGHFP
jgi:anaerobic selenocysteine-containing dehydrogenase